MIIEREIIAGDMRDTQLLLQCPSSRRNFAASLRSAFASDLPDQKSSSAVLSSRRGPIRGKPSVPIGTDLETIIKTPCVFEGFWNDWTLVLKAHGIAPCIQLATHRGTPPEDFSSVAAGLLARGSEASVWSSQCLAASVTLSDRMARRLQLRGQPGFGIAAVPGSLLASDKCLKNHDGGNLLWFGDAKSRLRP